MEFEIRWLDPEDGDQPGVAPKKAQPQSILDLVSQAATQFRPRQNNANAR
jgi:hypothetical protein